MKHDLKHWLIHSFNSELWSNWKSSLKNSIYMEASKYSRKEVKTATLTEDEPACVCHITEFIELFSCPWTSRRDTSHREAKSMKCFKVQKQYASERGRECCRCFRWCTVNKYFPHKVPKPHCRFKDGHNHWRQPIWQTAFSITEQEHVKQKHGLCILLSDGADNCRETQNLNW